MDVYVALLIKCFCARILEYKSIFASNIIHIYKTINEVIWKIRIKRLHNDLVNNKAVYTYISGILTMSILEG